MFVHFVLLYHVYSVYNGQMSPNFQRLVFLDVKEVAKCMTKHRVSKLITFCTFCVKIPRKDCLLKI